MNNTKIKFLIEEETEPKFKGTKMDKNMKKFVLISGQHKFVLRHPSITPYNTYCYEDISDIMYFYYNFEIYENKNYHLSSIPKNKRLEYCLNDKNEMKNTNWSEDWVEIASTYVTEFGVIPYLGQAIDDLKTVIPEKLGQKEYFFKDREKKVRSKTEYEAVYSYPYIGMFHEDGFDFKKYKIHFDYSADTNGPKNVTWYELIISCGFNESLPNDTCVRLGMLNENDLDIIKNWSTSFMEYAGELCKNSIDFNLFDTNSNDSTVKAIKEHISTKYPEDLPKLKEIMKELCIEEMILEEYENFCLGKQIAEPLFSHWSEEEHPTAQDFINQGMKDWEAYIALSNWYKKQH